MAMARPALAQFGACPCLVDRLAGWRTLKATTVPGRKTGFSWFMDAATAYLLLTRMAVHSRKLASFGPTSTLFYPVFSPDGKRVQFALAERIDLSSQLWEVSTDGSNL